MSITTILLIILILLILGGGNLGFGGAYRGPSNIVGILLIVLLVFLILRAAP